MRHLIFCNGDIILPASSADNASLTWDVFPFEAHGHTYHQTCFQFEDEKFCVSALDESQLDLAGGASRVKVRQLLGSLDAGQGALVLTALAYANWSLVSNYCASCGAALEDGSADYTNARVCNRCGRVFFPRISPAIIVLIHRDDSILLAHNVSFPEGRYGLVAGFVEAGETFEQTVRREVMEEAGIEIGEPRYVRSQPWPFPDSLMVAFEADWKSGEARPDGKEIGALGWFRLDALPDIPPPGSVARYLIDKAVEQARTHFPCQEQIQ
ncbi:MAG: NAD(+) diphosphatase [Spirochaetaceae bacterium]|nr:NAD(+) diphosphatase [Spirochaetaceae bacterium]